MELFSSKNKRWLFSSKQVSETLHGLTPNIKTKYFFGKKEPDYVAICLRNGCKTLLEGSDPLCPQRLRSKAYSASLLHRAAHCSAGAESLWQGPLPGPPQPAGHRGGTLPRSLIPPDGLSVREPSLPGQMEQQTLVKTKHSQFINVSILLGLLQEKSSLLFHGLHCSERLQKNLTRWLLQVAHLSLSLSLLPPPPYTQSPGPKRWHDLTGVSPMAVIYKPKTNFNLKTSIALSLFWGWRTLMDAPAITRI